MNSPNLGIDVSTSPGADAENQNNDHTKNWNKSYEKKVPSDPRLVTSSPRMDAASASASPMNSTKSFSRQNGLSVKKKFKLDEEEYESLEMACNLASEMPDDCDAFGKHVAAQLRQMSKIQKFMAQRLMSEICFRGQIQHLAITTNITNAVNASQTQQQVTQPQQPAQSLVPGTILSHRPPHMAAAMYGRSPDYLMLHQQAVRPTGTLPPFQNFLNTQSDHSAVPLEQVGTSYNNS